MLAATAGVQWETAGAAMGFAARFVLNAWIVAAVELAIAIMRRLDERVQHETLAFTVGFAVLVATDLLSDAVLG